MKPYFKLGTYKNDDGNHQVSLYYSHKGKQLYIDTKVRCKPQHFTGTTISSKDDDYESKNILLDNCMNKVSDIILNHTLQYKQQPTIEYLKDEYGKDGKIMDKEIDILNNEFEEWIKKKGMDIKNTKLYHTVLQDLKGYTGKSKGLYFRNITIDFLDGLKVYWLTTLKLQNSTINKRWRCFKQFLKSHRENKYKHYMDWNTGLNHIKSNSNIHLLTDEEWNKYRNKVFGNNYLGYVRDLYMISCTTGLRFSDVIRLSPIHFREKGWIIINVTKTEEGNLRIPLHPIANEILSRYNYQLRNISNQKCNVYLSKGLRECNIDYKVALYRKSGNRVTTLYLDKCDAIDFHSSRRHFVTKCIEGGIPINDIMAWTGHSSTTISKYIKKGGSNKDRMLQLFG